MSARNKQLCEFCSQKPRFGTHPYCSKGCAGQAAILCNYCRQKPKHGTYDFCGKGCASSANTNPLPASGTGAQVNAGFPGQAQLPPGGALNNKPKVPKLHKQPIAPPQQASHGPTTYFSANTKPAVTALQHPAVVPKGPIYTPPMANGYVLVPPANQVPLPNGHAAKHVPNSCKNIGQGYGKQVDATEYPEDCRIPGCGQPVYVDDDGPSEYCSMRHREEAVTCGIESPCIMCLALPQRETDYFCSRICKEDALSKIQEA